VWLAFRRYAITLFGEKNTEGTHTMNTGGLFFLSFGLPAIIGIIAYAAVLLHEREWRKHHSEPGE
jgi:hypothetical protein